MAKKPRRALVVGSGRAGLAAAAELAARGTPVLLLSRAPALGAQSARDHEGINGLGAGDSAEQLARDTWRQSYGLANRAALLGLGQAAAHVGSWLADAGVPFTRDARSQLARVALGGSSLPRTAFVAASTGRHLVRALDDQVRGYEEAPALEASGAAMPGEKLVRRLEHWRLVDLVLDDDGRTVGVVAQDRRTLAFKAFAADGVVLASGGYAGVFDGAACNASSLGGALGVAYRHGAVLANLEFVQPSPTVIASGPARMVLPEWLRWLGGRVWVTKKDARDPREVAEKDRRYVLEGAPEAHLDAARAALALLDAGAAPGERGRAFLDLTHLEADRLLAVNESLGGVLSKVFGVDPSRSPLPVEARVHYALGGVWVDGGPESGRTHSPRQHTTSLAGLYAAGEACHQYHGAHALSGNLALGDVAGGIAAARGVVAYRGALDKSAVDLPNSVFDRPAADAEKAFETIGKRDAGESANALLDELRTAMASGCGLERDGDRLENLLEALTGLRERAERVAPQGPRVGLNAEAELAAELPDVIALCRAVVSAAQSREESRGSHRRLDRDTTSARPRSTFVRAGDEGDADIVDAFEYRLTEESISIKAEAGHGE